MYASGLCFQTLSRRLRSALRGVELQDWDISNCMFTVTTQLVDKIKVDLPIPDASLRAWRRYAADPVGVREMLAGSFGADAKAVALKVAHGGACPSCTDHEALAFLVELSRESRLLRWWSCALLP